MKKRFNLEFAFLVVRCVLLMNLPTKSQTRQEWNAQSHHVVVVESVETLSVLQCRKDVLTVGGTSERESEEGKNRMNRVGN